MERQLWHGPRYRGKLRMEMQIHPLFQLIEIFGIPVNLRQGSLSEDQGPRVADTIVQ